MSLVASKRLATAREFLVAGDWDAAIEGLRLLSTELGDALVETGPGRCLNVRDACTALLSTMPAPGLARYRRLVDPEMVALCRAGRETRDPDIMRRIEAWARPLRARSVVPGGGRVPRRSGG